MRVNQQVGYDLLDFLEMPLNKRQIAVYIKINAGNGFADLSADNESVLHE